MSEQKPERKVVGRTVAIALGIIAIILAVGLVGAIANYTSIINGKNNTISSLNSRVSSLNYSMTEKDSQISHLNDSNEYLQNQVDCLYNITSLKNKTILDNATIAPGELMNETIGVNHSGYVMVWIEMSTSNSTTLRVTWSSSGTKYDQTINVGKSGRMVFPVLPSNVSFIIEHATSEFTLLVTLYY
jgi:hypothetical protein